MSADRTSFLLRQYINESATKEEKEELAAIIARDGQAGEVVERLQAMIDSMQYPEWKSDHLEELVHNVLLSDKMENVRPRGSRVRFLSIRRTIAAAAILAAIATGVYFWLQRAQKPGITQTSLQDVVPGTNKAILTLADGSTVSLNSAGHRVIQQGNTTVQQQGGMLQYDVQGIESTVSYNTLTTPKGGQYRVQLPDGTIAWLNAASGLKYPVNFPARSERRVELTGEAYFEVARDRTRPFIVSSEGQEVRVLGTHFNINAYRDEPTTRTTLFEGSVEVGAIAGSARTLVPGQQAELTGKTITVKTADSEAALAWKNGDFIFNADIKEIMRQIARWYDVEVTYQGNISNQEFFGTFSRSKDIHEILSALELTKRVHFKVKERRIIVMP